MNIKKWLIICGIIGVIVLIIAIASHHKPPTVSSFKECVDAGYEVSDTQPQTCTAQGKKFTAPSSAASSATSKLNLTFDTLVISLKGPVKPERIIITSQADWQAFWQRTHAHITPFPNIIAVDFTKDEVVAVVDGTKPTQGYSMKISEVSEQSGKVIVTVRDTVPPQNCIEPPPPVSPYHIIKFTKVAKPIEFEMISSAIGAACATPSTKPY